MRRPAVAGSFYPLNSKSLTEMLKKYTERRKEDSVVACVSPHAGYVYSGKTAGKVHSLLPDAETFVIIGPNHTGYGLPVAVSVDEWLTPLGKVEVDLEFVDAMPKKIVAVDELAHKYEHSLEVQLPFLQHLHEDFKIVPICLGLQDEVTTKEVAEEIIEAEKATKRRIVVVASSDMHHYLPDEECRKLDRMIIDAILSMNVARYYRRIYELNASVCGYGCIAVAMNYALAKNARAELVDYSTSGDVADRSAVVGYAGIVFRI
ncbi:MAG: MEMO1 family protein [Archaeoglobales archaeon]|nr:MEMO1 family protein [Archaeoglobales archaeon]